MQRDKERAQFLASRDIEELRFWNLQWRKNREGVLLEIWHALHRRTGCVKVRVRRCGKQGCSPPRPSPRSCAAKKGETKALNKYPPLRIAHTQSAR